MSKRIRKHPRRRFIPRSAFAAFSVLSALSAALSCSDESRTPNQPSTGSLEITTTTSGTPSAGDSYSYILDSNPAEPIDFNTTIQLTDLFVGSHTVELTGLPEGCSTASPNPATVGVTFDVPGTVTFNVSCVS
jgi:hypothetical protein